MKAARNLLVLLCSISCCLWIVSAEGANKNSSIKGKTQGEKRTTPNTNVPGVVSNANAGNAGTQEIDKPLSLSQEITRDEFERNKEGYKALSKQSRRQVGEGANDLWLWVKANSTLQTSSSLQGININADVNDGVVTLTGAKVTKEQHDEAEKLVNNIQGVTKINNKLQFDQDEPSWTDVIMRVGYYLLIALAVAALVGAIAYGVSSLRKKTIARTEAYFAAVRDRQKRLASQHETSIAELSRKFDDLIKEQRAELSALNQRLGTLRADLDALRRGGGVGAGGAAAAQPLNEYTGRVVETPAAVFPVSAEEYLRKLSRDAVRVKSDSLNDVLVRDADGTGELALVPDGGVPGGLLYVVPTVNRFTTRQDFHSYYEKFYDCYNPSAGEVWIVEPATVDTISGGWKLRDKGVLEARR
jgi:osmotically-inducible protein OsmY